MEKKFWFQVVGLLILIFGGLVLTFNQGVLTSLGLPQLFPGLTPGVPVARSKVAIIDGGVSQASPSAKVIFNVEIADTPEKRKTGLSGRDSLAAGSGILFILEGLTKPSFWMKGMKFPIDIIWVRDNVIVDLLQNVPPPVKGQSDSDLTRYAPVTEVNGVLEVNAGVSAAAGIKIGDRLQLIRN